MTWIKLWLILKKHWKKALYVVSLLAVIVLVLFFRRGQNPGEILQERSNAHRREVEQIEDSIRREEMKQEGLLEKYDEAVRLIDEEYRNAAEELTTETKDRAATIVKEANWSDEELAKRLSGEFGITYIPPRREQ